MMGASTFERLFVQHLAEPATAVGFERWGKELWLDGPRGMRAAVIRTEARSTWPFELTLVLGHECLRDFEDRVPAPKTRNPSEWPIKIAPSKAADLLKRRWRYESHNLGRWPSDVMDDVAAIDQLQQIGMALTGTFPDVADVITPEAVRQQLAKRGEDAWCELRWVADYDAHLGG